VAVPAYRYINACRKHMAHSATTRREHRFEDRFATTLRLLEIEQLPEMAVLSRWVDQFGGLIAQDAEMVDGAIGPSCAACHRLELSARIGCLKRLGLRRHFCAVVVSSDLGWLKPHPKLYRTALTRIRSSAAHS